MHRGYVKVWRKMEDSGILQDQAACQFFLWAMFKATHRERKQIVGNQVVNLLPGQFVSGRKAASEELGISQSKFVRTVEKMKNIEFVDSKPNNKFTVFTIINWDTYQSEKTTIEQQTEQQADNKRTTSEQQTDTNNNYKHIKNEKKKDTYAATHPEYAAFAVQFQTKAKDMHGNIAPAISDSLINNATETVDKLIRIDGFTFEQVCDAMNWAMLDDFWSKNALSLAGLRAKNGDGRTKFQKIMASMDGRKNKQTFDNMAGVI